MLTFEVVDIWASLDILEYYSYLTLASHDFELKPSLGSPSCMLLLVYSLHRDKWIKRDEWMKRRDKGINNTLGYQHLFTVHLSVFT